jgi:hypothetical protein
MSSLLQPLRLMVYRRQSMIATASLQFSPADSRHAGAPIGVTRLPISGTGHIPDADAIENAAENPDQGVRAHSNTVKIKAIEPLFIETKYGIRLDIADKDHASLNVSETSQASEGKTSRKVDVNPPRLLVLT